MKIEMIILEAFGYIGTALVIVSMLMTSIFKLRIINICGSVISAIYSAMVSAWPIVVMNACLVIINLYQIAVYLKRHREFTAVKARYDDGSLLHFISLYKNGIKSEFPEYDFNIDEKNEIWLIYHESSIISVLIGKIEADSFIVDINYTLSKYRSNTDNYIIDLLKSKNIKIISAKCDSDTRSKRLKKLGFCEQNERFVREL